MKMRMIIPNRPYKSWDVKHSSFPVKGGVEAKAEFLLRYAVLAPSSHNMQPWIFKIEKNVIRIYMDYSRALPYSDRKHRELLISIGCSLANIIVAAEHFNLSYEIDYFPEDEIEDVVVRVLLEENSKTNKESILHPLFNSLTERMVNRFPYLEKKISGQLLDKIKKFNDDEDLITVYFITRPDCIKKISQVVYKASMFAFSDNLFKHELSEWITSIYSRRCDGIPLFDAGIPGALTVFAPWLIARMPAKLQAVKDRELVATSPALLVVGANMDNKVSWVKTGKIFEYVALACARHGISMAPMAGVIEHEECNDELRKLAGIKNNPLFFARVGYASKFSHHSPRRDYDQVLIR